MKVIKRFWRLRIWLNNQDTAQDVAAKAAGVVAVGVLFGWWLLTYVVR